MADAAGTMQIATRNGSTVHSLAHTSQEMDGALCASPIKTLPVDNKATGRGSLLRYLVMRSLVVTPQAASEAHSVTPLRQDQDLNLAQRVRTRLDRCQIRHLSRDLSLKYLLNSPNSAQHRGCFIGDKDLVRPPIGDGLERINILNGDQLLVGVGSCEWPYRPS